MGSDHEDEFVAWQRSLAGDGRAFTSIFDMYYGRVYRHVVWASGSTAEAEDLTAATFMELWRRREKVRLVDKSVLPWLLVTAGNVARNATRSRHRYRKLLAKIPAAGDAPDIAVEVAARLDGERKHADLAAALKTLGRIDQELISLTAFEGISLQAASEAVGLSYGAAKTRLSRARRHLSTHLSRLTAHEEGIRS
jgi:RNA polymerase sigma-70 factor (ECF subfamily)